MKGYVCGSHDEVIDWQWCIMFCSGTFVDDDFQRRLDRILVDVKSLEDLINDIQSPKKSSENEVNEKIKVLVQNGNETDKRTANRPT